jgi:hypothetical protein
MDDPFWKPVSSFSHNQDNNYKIIVIYPNIWYEISWVASTNKI